jgi:hypothetical protein
MFLINVGIQPKDYGAETEKKTVLKIDSSLLLISFINNISEAVTCSIFTVLLLKSVMF